VIYPVLPLIERGKITYRKLDEIKPDERSWNLATSNSVFNIDARLRAAAQGAFVIQPGPMLLYRLSEAEILLRDPRYMAEYRRLAKRYVAGDFHNIQAQMARSNRDTETADTVAFKDRFEFVTSWLSINNSPQTIGELARFTNTSEMPIVAAYRDIFSKALRKFGHIPNDVNHQAQHYVDEKRIEALKFYEENFQDWGAIVNGHEPSYEATRWVQNADNRDQHKGTLIRVPQELYKALKKAAVQETKPEIILTTVQLIHNWAHLTHRFNRPETWLEWALDPTTQPDLEAELRATNML
jgi:hypothetical protein